MRQSQERSSSECQATGLALSLTRLRGLFLTNKWHLQKARTSSRWEILMNSTRGVRTPFLAGLFLICMCSLMLQILETRMLSVISWYYLAFFAISMAMFGMTAGSLLIYFNAGRFTAERML
jgi:hypothetical protein